MTKNRIHGTLARYNVQVAGVGLFGVAARLELGTRLPELPVHSREAVEQELATLDFLEISDRIGGAAVERDYEGECGSGSAKNIPCVARFSVWF